MRFYLAPAGSADCNNVSVESDNDGIFKFVSVSYGPANKLLVEGDNGENGTHCQDVKRQGKERFQAWRQNNVKRRYRLKDGESGKDV